MTNRLRALGKVDKSVRSSLTTVVLAILLLVPFAFSMQVFIRSATSRRASAGTQTIPVKRYALIVCGTAQEYSYEPLHRGDAVYMYHVLTRNCTFESIEYLSVYHNDPGVTGAATVQNVRDAIHRLVNRPNPQSSDILLIYISAEGVGMDTDNPDHIPDLRYGGRILPTGSEEAETGQYYDYYGVLQNYAIAVDGGLVLEDTTFQEHGPAVNAYWGTDVKADLSGLNGNNGMLVYAQQSCYAGDMIDDLSGPNRTIMCATKETWGARGDTGFDYYNPPPMPPDWGFGISEWSERFIDALNGQRAYFLNETGEIMETRVDWPEVVQADTDGNGVSMLEAWQYALSHDEAYNASKEFPWFDDNNNRLPTYRYGDHLDAADGDFSSRIFLTPLIGDVNGDLIVDIFDAILLALAYNSQPGDRNWDLRADLKRDDIIDLYDALLLAGNFGKRRPDIVTGRSAGSSGGALTESGVSVSLDPSQITVFKDEAFRVNVSVASVTDLLGWEFKLYWNSTILNCTNAVVQSPSEWQNNTQDYGPGLETAYNATHARFWKAETAAYPAPSFNGSMTIAMLTFKALQPGTTSLALVETKLGNSTADPIDHTESGGSVTVYYGRYMRSDAATVNGLNANLLNATETTSYAYVQQLGQGAGAQFGIRAWVRASNGTEYEVTLDGQTGTPKATVTSTGWGTVNVTQKTMQTTFSFVTRVYVRIAGGAWTNKATFTTEQLGKTSLLGMTWSVYYYVSVSYSVKLDRTTAKFYWGDASHMSRIQNLQFN